MGLFIFTSNFVNSFFILRSVIREHLTCAMSINAYSSQKLENLEPDHKEK